MSEPSLTHPNSGFERATRELGSSDRRIGLPDDAARYTTLREAALALGVDGADFDRIVDPRKMVGDPYADLGLERAAEAA